MKGIKTKDYFILKYRIKLQMITITAVILGVFTGNYLSKINIKIFNIAREIISAVMLNIILLFFKKK
ncbi:hypothetical protein [Tissierella pigra]|uniref:hypothetical protein n=1 Tax=Tissierella pigra TaxID=2607614 RepID=UPI0018A6B888|nr:hypothetical protein [Tissierella pigra]